MAIVASVTKRVKKREMRLDTMVTIVRAYLVCERESFGCFLRTTALFMASVSYGRTGQGLEERD